MVKPTSVENKIYHLNFFQDLKNGKVAFEQLIWDTKAFCGSDLMNGLEGVEDSGDRDSRPKKSGSFCLNFRKTAILSIVIHYLLLEVFNIYFLDNIEAPLICERQFWFSRSFRTSNLGCVI